MQKAALYTSGVVFAAVAVAHVARLATGFEIVVGGARRARVGVVSRRAHCRPARRLDGGRGAALVGPAENQRARRRCARHSRSWYYGGH